MTNMQKNTWQISDFHTVGLLGFAPQSTNALN